MSEIKTITVPYIPNIGVNNIQYAIGLDDRQVQHAREKLKGYELREIKGSHLALLEGEWCEIGYNLVFRKLTKPSTSHKTPSTSLPLTGTTDPETKGDV